VTNACPSYNWINPEKHQLCWSHVTRNLQQIADYSGGGYTAYVGRRLTLVANMIFRIRHRLERNEISHAQYLRRMQRLQKSLDDWLEKGSTLIVQRYKGRCEKLQQHRQSLWLFLNNTSILLTNNEAERRIRGCVIQRKISYGTTSDAGDKFRDRIHSLVETFKKRVLSTYGVFSEIVQAVTARQPDPNVFNL
jgi:transposase